MDDDVLRLVFAAIGGAKLRLVRGEGPTCDSASDRRARNQRPDRPGTYSDLGASWCSGRHDGLDGSGNRGAVLDQLAGWYAAAARHGFVHDRPGRTLRWCMVRTDSTRTAWRMPAVLANPCN